MSIQTELTRITNAKAAVKAAIEGKGVTVPEGTKLDGMAALVESIEAGGGGKIVTGTFTLAESARNITINHGLGVVPNFGLIIVNPSYSPVDNTLCACAYFPNIGGYGYYRTSSTMGGGLKATTYTGIDRTTPISSGNAGRYFAAIFNATADSVMFGYFEDNDHNFMLSTKPYLWALGVIE